MVTGYDPREVLAGLDPRDCDYTEWTQVGMCLQAAGLSAADWDDWSRRDSGRYHPGECEKKWRTFTPGAGVTTGTLVHIARDHGWEPPARGGRVLDWNDEIVDDGLRIIDPAWLESREVSEPGDWNPAEQLTRYLETLFDPEDKVGYVTQSWHDDAKDKYMPTKGCWDRTAGTLIKQLQSCHGDLGAVLGDYNPDVGAWIRFNPLDGNGAKNENVSEFRYALVESDTVEIDKQNAIYHELELPIAALVHSGRKSLHAIVRIDAPDYAEYRKRVDYLYDVLQKNGLQVDTQNKNPSRLSRMPGVMRAGHKQYLVDTNIGKANWEEWRDYIEAATDDLPDPESIADTWDNLPDLAPPLIDGILRQGHKMLLAGPSKAGKSFLLIELAISLAEGSTWLGWPCTQGRVLYVNLELDRASCLHRFADVYDALGIPPRHLHNLDVWNLRGSAVPMDKLAPKLIRRALKKGYVAVIIDPIYKVITGDENSADQMAHFCNQFDKICYELGCSVIYCHHHSKGMQGQKRSMDRASGSGVFARDPDALLDLIELDLPRDLRDPDNPLRTAWRIEGTLREFPRFVPVNVWFDYPTHALDTGGALAEVSAGNDNAWNKTWQKNFPQRRTAEQTKSDRVEALEVAYSALQPGLATLKTLSEYMGVTQRTVKNYVHESGEFKILNDGTVGKFKEFASGK